MTPSIELMRCREISEGIIQELGPIQIRVSAIDAVYPVFTGHTLNNLKHQPGLVHRFKYTAIQVGTCTYYVTHDYGSVMIKIKEAERES